MIPRRGGITTSYAQLQVDFCASTGWSFEAAGQPAGITFQAAPCRPSVLGGADGLVPYRIEKALRVAEAVMARRDVRLTDADRALLTAIAEEAGPVPA